MDYQGRSIQTGGADPAILIIQGEIADLQTRVKSLDGAVGNLETEEKQLQTQLTQVQTRLTSLEGVVQTMQTVLGDCGSIVLTCPVATDTATLRVPIAFNWDTFYSTGYQPVGTPFDLTPFATNNFQLAIPSVYTGTDQLKQPETPQRSKLTQKQPLFRRSIWQSGLASRSCPACFLPRQCSPLGTVNRDTVHPRSLQTGQRV